MRCNSCNNPLSDYEATRKTLRGEYLDLCNSCYKSIANEVPTIDRPDLLGVEQEKEND